MDPKLRKGKVGNVLDFFFYQTLLGEISGETSKVTRICEGRDLRH